MCCPFAFIASCGSADEFKFSKVILTAEQTKTYQVPWEKQQKKLAKQSSKRICLCWCCTFTCLCKPVENRRHRKISTSDKIERRAMSYKSLIERIKPNVAKVKKWSSNFQELLEDDDGVMVFETFLKEEHSDENIQFWKEVDSLRKIKKSLGEKREMMKKIYLDYLRPLAAKEINVNSEIRKKIEEELAGEPPSDVFDSAQYQVVMLMQRQCYPRFLTSEIFSAISQCAYAADAVKVT